MVRIMKGEVAMRLEVWKTGNRMDRHADELLEDAAIEAQFRIEHMESQLAEHEANAEADAARAKADAGRESSEHAAMQAALEAQMRAQGQGAGLRMLKQIMVRMVKGEAAMRIEIWRTTMKDEVRLADMARMQRELEARAASASQGAALRQLKQIMIRIMKGEVAMRLEVWRTGMRTAMFSTKSGEELLLEKRAAEMLRRSASMRLLQQTMRRVAMGVVRYSLHNWRAESEADRLAMMQRSNMSASQSLAMRTVLSYVARLSAMQQVQAVHAMWRSAAIGKARKLQGDAESEAAKKLAKFTAAALAMQTRLDNKLVQHLQDLSMRVLSRMFGAYQKEWARQAILVWFKRRTGAKTVTHEEHATALKKNAMRQLTMGSMIQEQAGALIYFVLVRWHTAYSQSKQLTKHLQMVNSFNLIRESMKNMLRDKHGAAIDNWQRNLKLANDAQFKEMMDRYQEQSAHFQNIFARKK